MELLFEFIGELIFSIVLEGAMGTAKSKKVPMPIRIIAGVLVLLFFVATIGIVALVGIISLRKNTLFGIFILGIAAIMVVVLIKKVVRFKRTRG